jgi:hypothetical protein
MLLFLQKPARTDEMAKPGISGLKAIHRQILVSDIGNIPDEYFMHSSFNQRLSGNLNAFSSMFEMCLP